LNQQRFVNNYLGKECFLPSNGCAGPVEIRLEKGITMLVLDTQWWLHQHAKSTVDEGCLVSDVNEFSQALNESILDRNDERLLVVGHHPLASSGEHGGHFHWTDHLFPLAALSDRLYIPLPVLGSIYPLYRKNIGSIQDIPHLTYRAMRDSIMGALKKHPSIVYASGHDHHLEYRNTDGVDHIISGSGSKTTYVKRNRRTSFLHSHRGLVRLKYYDNGEVWMEFIEPEHETHVEKIVFRKQLAEPKLSMKVDQLLQSPVSSFTDYSDSTTIFPGFSIYNTGKLNRFFFGEHYRASWTTPVQVPLFDLKREQGGLKILKRGGGFQTTSVRLENDLGRQFVLRSVQKDPQTVIPGAFRRTFARRILQDQISASHPYGALAIPRLADAAGIYHSNPRLVVVPDEPYLGKYRSALANQLVIYEERPKGDMSHAAHFGHTQKVMSTPDVLEKIRKNHKHRVDQRFVIRNRVFDMFVGDWDRHEDQWRWARFEDEKGKYYRPIPRDRDQVFYRADGFFPGIANRKWAVRKFQHFEGKTRDVPGLNFNARHFDRFFTTEMTLQDWLNETSAIQANMTDEVIEQAIRDLPPEVYENDGATIVRILKERRAHLAEMVEAYYYFLNKVVQLPLTDRDDYVRIHRLNNDSTLVQVYQRKKSGEAGKRIYSRVFLRSETDEIRIHGLDGDDFYHLEGKVKRGIKVRIKGGKGKDIVQNESRVRGMARKLVYYDRKSKSNFKAINGDTKLALEKGKSVYSYEPRWFRYNVTAPMIDVGLNPDDGLFFGGGVRIKHHEFEKEPYGSLQKIHGAYAPQTGSFNLHYEGDFIGVYKKLDLEVNAKSLVPNYLGNFYGLGNGSQQLNNDANYYRIRYQENKAIVALKKRLGSYFEVKAGPFFTHFKVERSADRFITSSLLSLDRAQFEHTLYTGGLVEMELDKRDSEVFTRNGVRWKASAAYYEALEATNNSFIRFDGDLRLYYTLFLPFEATLANRVGGAYIMDGKGNDFNYDGNDFPFFLGAVVGGDNRISSSGNLRGTPRGRFTGRSSAYFNNDIRIPLIHFQHTRITGKLGVLGFWDTGRVWFAPGESEKWHQGYGGGIWYTPFDIVSLSATYAISEGQDNFFYLNTGFAF
jgi:hypothetical protein